MIQFERVAASMRINYVTFDTDIPAYQHCAHACPFSFNVIDVCFGRLFEELKFCTIESKYERAAVCVDGIFGKGLILLTE